MGIRSSIRREVDRALKSYGERWIGYRPPPEELARPEERTGRELTGLGLTGLRRSGRGLDEEEDPKLRGWRKKAKKYEEMADNSAGMGGALGLMTSLLARVPLYFEAPAGSPPEAQAIAEFYQSCLDDMDTPWTEIRTELYSAVQFGFSLLEPVYKIRWGDAPDPVFASRHADGLIGWRDLEPRSQDSISEWVWQGNRLVGFRQLVEGEPGEPFVPMSKAIHLKLRGRKRSPEGRSFLRSALNAYEKRMTCEAWELIGVERNLDGLPIARVPREMLEDGASDAERAVVASVKAMTRGVRRDELEGIVYPASEDAKGKTGFEFGVISTGVDPSKADPVIRRYRSDELVALLCEFLILGSEQSGSWALHDSSTSLLGHSLGYVLQSATDAFTAQEVPRLARLNRFPAALQPRLRHGDMESADLGKLSAYISAAISAGAMTPDGLDAHLRAQAGLPPPYTAAPEIGAQDSAEEPEAPPEAPLATTEQLMGSWTAAEAAERLGVSRATVSAMVRRGDLQGLRSPRGWRVRPEEVERFLAALNAPAERTPSVAPPSSQQVHDE